MSDSEVTTRARSLPVGRRRRRAPPGRATVTSTIWQCHAVERQAESRVYSDSTGPPWRPGPPLSWLASLSLRAQSGHPAVQLSRYYRRSASQGGAARGSSSLLAWLDWLEL